MTKGGAGSLLKFYRDTLKCKVIKEPEAHPDGVRWTLTVTEPVFKDV